MKTSPLRFALIGAAGYVAPRHMKAIKDTGNQLVAALDKNDSVGVMDSYFPDADFFTEPERFDRHLYKLMRQPGKAVDYVSICSPNYLHDAHIRLAMRNGAHAICEKPLVLNPWNLDALADIEKETGKKIFTILQLRLHPALQALKQKIDAGPAGKIYDVDLQYFTRRGRWYHISWKGDLARSGGIATNIGIHFFDMLTWIFGDVKENSVKSLTATGASGFLQLEKARVNWILSVDDALLPDSARLAGQHTFRSITVDGEAVEFHDGFNELHSESYRQILNGNGFGLEDARRSIEIVQAIRMK